MILSLSGETIVNGGVPRSGTQGPRGDDALPCGHQGRPLSNGRGMLDGS